ncbi:MAG: cell wall metabolism sensor histidine kinase WalK [Elusimicrobiales bacterium]|nr:cell wall metabolism sensor histidine kinase WalK [Elusimicrobiales bacterium]
MTDAQDPKLLWFSFLKTFTRALVQINLYKPDHPQVRQALDEGQALLGQIADSLGGGDLSVTIDNDKLLINGVPLVAADKLPNSLRNLYTKFRLQTITFKPGASGEDLLALCQVQAHKGEAKAFLAERGVEKIKLDEAVYAKVDSARTPGAASVVTPGQTGAAGQAASPQEKVAEKISGQSFESALATVVGRVTSDPEEQRRVIALLEAKFRDAVEAGVTRALEEVRREKKKVENDMARTESVMTSMADGVVVVDKDGKILMMNPQAEAISGKPLAELSGKKIVDLSQIENQVVSLAKEIKSENRADISKEIIKTGSAEIAETVKKATALIQNEDGKIVGSVSIPTDAVKLKQVEQLQQDFIANMTHELRSPLTSIKAALEIMGREAGAPTESARGILNTAIRNTERLNSIITDILDFSKLQSGKMVFHQEGAAAGDIVREAAEAMRAWTTSKGITLNVNVEPGVQHVYADKRRTVQVLINLVSNAIKFTPQGGTIEISADAGKEALSGFSFFSVKDTGCGIKKEDQGKIFEKFVQVASGEKVGGTGLGLSITKAMVVMQGGRITLESEPGKGSTFRVGMPVYKGQGDQQVFEQVPEVKEAPKPWWKKLLGM